MVTRYCKTCESRQDFYTGNRQCFRCHQEMPFLRFHYGIWIAVGLVAFSGSIIFTILDWRKMTMANIWNGAITALELAGLAAVIIGIGFIIFHRIKAYLKRASIKDDWADKRLESQSHHDHQIFLDDLERQKNQKALPAAPAQGAWKQPRIRKRKEEPIVAEIVTEDDWRR